LIFIFVIVWTHPSATVGESRPRPRLLLPRNSRSLQPMLQYANVMQHMSSPSSRHPVNPSTAMLHKNWDNCASPVHSSFSYRWSACLLQRRKL